MPKHARLCVALLVLLAGACGGGDGGSPADTTTLTWLVTGLEPLATGYVYEGWLIMNGNPTSTGRFNVDADGTPKISSMAASEEMAALATAWVLTIEPDPDPDPGPAETKLLGGNFVERVAQLTTDHAAALGTDFGSATGQFILATPTSAVTTDESQGIWWVNPGTGLSSLNLPELPPGWTYEGWVVGNAGPISTGRFTDPGAADSDMAGPAKGPDSDGPPFPGQDFVSPPTDLVGLTAVISVEPSPDDSPAPFALKPLVASPITNDLAPSLQDMDNNAAATNPAGMAQFE